MKFLLNRSVLHIGIMSSVLDVGIFCLSYIVLLVRIDLFLFVLIFYHIFVFNIVPFDSMQRV